MDPGLLRLCQQERTGARLPIPLEHFRQYAGRASLLEAIQLAVRDVLVRACGQAIHGRVSADQLCRACGVRLEGVPPRLRGQEPLLAAYRGALRTSHAGALRLDPTRTAILLPRDMDYFHARVVVAHELGHFLVHSRGNEGLDPVSITAGSSPEEEALAEYAARLFLLWNAFDAAQVGADNLAAMCLTVASSFEVTVHAAVARLGDPDRKVGAFVEGAILWRMNPKTPATEITAHRLTPHWHLCGDQYVPIHACVAGSRTLVGELADRRDGQVQGSVTESVAIGSFKGTFRVDAVAWGSVARGTRTVLSVFVRSDSKRRSAEGLTETENGEP